MAGNLIIPRVEVYWGDVNLTSYNKDGDYPRNEPLVYKVECILPQQSDNPSGSMMWAPTAQAYKIYEDLLKEKIDAQIVTTFGYLGKKKVSLVWMWGGNQYVYGNTMGLKVHLLSELSGLINSTVRSVSNNADKAMTMKDAIKTTEKLFTIDKYKLVTYTETAKKDLESNKIQNQYGRDQTFVSSINNIVKENGNYIFSTNIVSDKEVTGGGSITGRAQTASKLVIFTPFQHEGNKDTVLDGQSRGYDEFPDPTKRYGYLIGPSLINTMERSYQWAPPQQENLASPAKDSTPTKTKKKKGKGKPPVNTQQEKAATPKGAVISPASAAPNPGIRVQKDTVGPDKKILMQQEAAAKLSFNTFLVPALVGIKPYDIIYIPSLNASGPEDIEDWIVNTVDYNQTDGGVDISVTASRTYGTGGTLMNSTSGQKFLNKAKTLKTLEKWEEYAWLITGSTETVDTTADVGQGAVQQLQVVPFQQ
jgi:hypothetical protein